MKKTSFFVILFSLFFGAFFLISIFKPQQSFSENENRLLQTRPDFLWEDVISGEFGTKYENYLADQFVFRDQWIQIKTWVEQIRGMKEINGVYITKDEYLIEKMDSSVFEGEQSKKNISYLKKFFSNLSENPLVESYNVMFVPTAETVLKDKLPSFVSVYDQYEWMRNTGLDYIDLEGCYNGNNELKNSLYYRTDHHWTSYGAYVAYFQWIKKIGMEPAALVQFDINTVSNNFLGTLHSKVNTKVTPDQIEAFNNHDLQLSIIADEKEIALYDNKKLESKDQYGYFLGGNYGQVIINNSEMEDSNRNLLIIKDSYANCFVPFAASHFDKTIMIDLRHTNQSIYDIIEQEKITDVLVLYSTDNFCEDRNLFKLNR